MGGVTICIIIGCIGFLLGTHFKNLPCWIDTAFTCLPFFALGNIIRHHTSFLSPGKFNKVYINLLLAVLCLGLVVLCSGHTCYRANHFYMPFWRVCLCALLGSLAIFLTAKNMKSTLLIYLGKNSLVILCIHQAILMALAEGLKFVGLNNWLGAIINMILTMLICYCLIPVLGKWLPHVSGQKDLIINKTLNITQK